MHKAVFIDRDGTLNEMVYDETHGVLDSPRRPEDVVLMPYAAEFLRGARALGFLRVVVTNQPGLAKGTMTETDLELVNGRLSEMLAADGEAWDELRYCPHHPRGGRNARQEYVKSCNCRKPQPGMLQDAARRLSIDLTPSFLGGAAVREKRGKGWNWMVGDGINDVQAGNAVGCRTVLVTTLKIEQIERFYSMKNALPDFVVPNLRAALAVIKKAETELGLPHTGN